MTRKTFILIGLLIAVALISVFFYFKNEAATGGVSDWFDASHNNLRNFFGGGGSHL